MSSFLKSGTGRIVIGVGAVAIIFIAILVFQPGGPGSDLPEINIVTRHDVAIQNSFTEAFLESSYAQDLGYTAADADKINYIQVSSLQAWIKALESDTRQADLAWGGGPTLFNQLADRGLLSTITNQSVLDIIDESVPEEIGGVEMYGFNDDDDITWVANAISSFGFTVNNDKLDELNLDKPTTWEELASPEYFRGTSIPTVSLGNPTLTTSNTRIYHIILQKFGWEKGWEVLGRMAGNGEIYGGSVATRSAIINGEVAVGMTIDFYGVFAQTDCAEKQASCEYVIPTNGSIINGDPIAFATKGVNPDGAFAFFEYVNSAEGQANWVKNDRLPVNVDAFNTTVGQERQDVKDLYDVTLANQGIEFDDDLAEAVEFTLQNYFDSAIAAPHPELINAWSELITALDNDDINQTEFDEKSAELFAPQLTLQEAQANNEQLINDNAYFLTQKSDWENTARDHYNDFSPTGLLQTLSADRIAQPMNSVVIPNDVSENQLQFTPILLVNNPLRD